MTIILNGQSLDQEIKNLESIDKTHDSYIKSCERLIILRQKKISNSDLAVNGREWNNSFIIQPLGTTIGSMKNKTTRVNCAGIMYDSDDHYDHDQSLQDKDWHKKSLCWVGIPRVRAGKHDKNHAGNSTQTRATAHPRTNLRQQMRAIRGEI